MGRGVVQLLEAKVEVVRSYPKPKKKKDMRAFLGLANYYRRFIAGFASIAVPLTDATRKIAPDKINWSHEMEEAFQQIKDSLTSNPVLSSPDTQKPFCLQTDASGIGIGAVLSQQGTDGAEHPVAYYSRKLLPRETRYTVSEQECLAVVEAIKHFKVYLTGAEFTVMTDHSSLIYLDKLKDENGRLTRWALALQPYMFKVYHRPGKCNANADGLSRQSWEEAGKWECHIPTSVSEEKEGNVTGLPRSSSTDS